MRIALYLSRNLATGVIVVYAPSYEEVEVGEVDEAQDEERKWVPNDAFGGVKVSDQGDPRNDNSSKGHPREQLRFKLILQLFLILKRSGPLLLSILDLGRFRPE